MTESARTVAADYPDAKFLMIDDGSCLLYDVSLFQPLGSRSDLSSLAKGGSVSH